MTSAVVIDAIRTPSGRGKPGGSLSGVHPIDLLAGTLSALVERTGIDPSLIDDVIGGCVSQVGQQTYNITRTAVLGAGFPETVPATTVDRQCGSSQQAAAFAAQGVISGAYDVVIACGVESMSRFPIGSSTLGDDIYGDRVRERYPEGLVAQGISAELIANRWNLSRTQVDDFSALSHQRAAAAQASGAFDNEIVSVNTPTARSSPSTRQCGPLRPLRVWPIFRQLSGLRSWRRVSLSSGGLSRRVTPRP